RSTCCQQTNFVIWKMRKNDDGSTKAHGVGRINLTRQGSHIQEREGDCNYDFVTLIVGVTCGVVETSGDSTLIALNIIRTTTKLLNFPPQLQQSQQKSLYLIQLIDGSPDIFLLVVLNFCLCQQSFFYHIFHGVELTKRASDAIGKPAVLKKIKSDRHLQTQGEVFLMESMGKDDVCKAGEEALVNLYGGMPLEGLDILRWRKFTTKTMVLNRSSIVQVQTLPPTSDAAQFHSMRVYLQCQYWRGKTAEEMDPCNGIIHCNSKTDCDNRRCSCRKNGIPCSSGCGECRGINCSNSKLELEELDVEGNEDT
ncbi:Hypothetical predicted protein, partial [Mytilus galloprovincialis]